MARCSAAPEMAQLGRVDIAYLASDVGYWTGTDVNNPGAIKRFWETRASK
jgi:hypothetical protein